MRRPGSLPNTILLGAVALLALSACEQGKPRHPPRDPMAIVEPGEDAAVAAPAGPSPGLSQGLPKRPQVAGFFLDHIGAATDPRNHPPAKTPADQPIVFDGFGFDPVAEAPGEGVDVLVDGKAIGAAYGKARGDVARFFKAPGLVNVGFRTILPAGSLAVGEHKATVRVIAVDGKSYFELPVVIFWVN